MSVIQGTPTFQVNINVNDQYAADASSAVPVTEQVRVVSDQATADQLVTTPGTANAMSVQSSAILTLGVSATVTIDLTALASRGGATKALAKVRDYYIEDLNAADSPGTFVVSSTGANGWTNGPFSTTGQTIKSHGIVAGQDRSAAGMAVDSTHKIVTFVNGTTARTVKVFFAGD